uniref:ABC transporter domain-containing protein n=1 Tax=Pseudo-nitzschia delicatissima TaxID=44447 RepID=A0A7S0YCL7_9STRA|mmetsp:Transcript_4936/g.10257  ORF Transcript_4936/g.10257 Transcript_4936/m.10257 type:complete len:602 (+) Transcript_4936:666-2471(+)
MAKQLNASNGDNQALVALRARPIGDKAPFGESIEISLKAGSCVELRGPSGRGKSTIANVLTGIHDASHQRSLLQTLQLQVVCDWNQDIPVRERCGVLFQQTTLLDELTVAGNLAVALKLHEEEIFGTPEARDARIKELLDTVGLNYGKDAHKLPSQLSGGMGRRVCLALQLAQRKRVIVLDEPFTGLDTESAISVARELVRLRKTQGTALLLISHEPHLSKLVHGDEEYDNIVELKAPRSIANGTLGASSHRITKPSLFGTTFQDRFLERLMDYVLFSLPLILMAFAACGLAISMLSADLLQRLDISSKVLDLVDTEVRPLIKMLTGEEASTFQMMGIRFKVNSMLHQTVPPAKATLYAIGLAKLFVLEVGPLLTALLLCGRIGGSYAGKVGTMQATNQNKLLKVLGVDPRWWTLAPAILAASLASPILTILGTMLALGLGGWVGPLYGMNPSGVGDQTYWDDLRDSVFPVLRLASFEECWESNDESGSKTVWELLSSLLAVLRKSLLDPGSLDLRATSLKASTYKDTMIEVVTYPPIYHFLKAEVYIWIVIGVAEWVARFYKPNLTPRGVPSVITLSVVLSGLLVILADWGFSQLLMQRQ